MKCRCCDYRTEGMLKNSVVWVCTKGHSPEAIIIENLDTTPFWCPNHWIKVDEDSIGKFRQATIVEWC